MSAHNARVWDDAALDYRRRCVKHWPKPFKDKKTGMETPTDAGFIHATEPDCAECEVAAYLMERNK